MVPRIYTEEDWSSLEELLGAYDDLDLSDRRRPFTNLGLYADSKGYRSQGYVGVTWLKAGGRTRLDANGNKCVLKIVPRFPGLKPLNMLNELKDDEEFARYLTPEKSLLSGTPDDGDILMGNELFHFYPDEPPIFMQDEVMQENSILTVILFLNGCKALCEKPLMGAMQKHEENLMGKVKGKILFPQHVKHNTARARDERIYCRYQVYSVDILENRILKYALVKASRFLNRFFGHVPSQALSGYRQIIQYCNKALEHVSVKPLTESEIRSAKVSGFYAYYKPVLEAAKMVIRGIALQANGEAMESRYVTPYAINMQKLYEYYVRTMIKKKLKEKPDWNIVLMPYFQSHELYGKEEKLYLMRNVRPDIVLEYHRQEGDKSKVSYAVFDVKYKKADTNFFAREDTHQLLSYSMLYDSAHFGFLMPDCEERADPTMIHTHQSEDRYYYQFRVSCENNYSAGLERFIEGIAEPLVELR